jgi:hypothetical protein
MWIDSILEHSRDNPGPRLPQMALGEFLAGLSSIVYAVTLYAEVAGCQFQTTCAGVARFSRETFDHLSKPCLWLFEDNDKWLALPVDTVGSIDGDAWRFEAEHVEVKLTRGGDTDARSKAIRS